MRSISSFGTALAARELLNAGRLNEAAALERGVILFPKHAAFTVQMEAIAGTKSAAESP